MSQRLKPLRSAFLTGLACIVFLSPGYAQAQKQTQQFWGSTVQCQQSAGVIEMMVVESGDGARKFGIYNLSDFITDWTMTGSAEIILSADGSFTATLQNLADGGSDYAPLGSFSGRIKKGDLDSLEVPENGGCSAMSFYPSAQSILDADDKKISHGPPPVTDMPARRQTLTEVKTPIPVQSTASRPQKPAIVSDMPAQFRHAKVFTSGFGVIPDTRPRPWKAPQQNWERPGQSADLNNFAKIAGPITALYKEKGRCIDKGGCQEFLSILQNDFEGEILYTADFLLRYAKTSLLQAKLEPGGLARWKNTVGRELQDYMFALLILERGVPEGQLKTEFKALIYRLNTEDLPRLLDLAAPELISEFTATPVYQTYSDSAQFARVEFQSIVNQSNTFYWIYPPDTRLGQWFANFENNRESLFEQRAEERRRETERQNQAVKRQDQVAFLYKHASEVLRNSEKGSEEYKQAQSDILLTALAGYKPAHRKGLTIANARGDKSAIDRLRPGSMVCRAVTYHNGFNLDANLGGNAASPNMRTAIKVKAQNFREEGLEPGKDGLPELSFVSRSSAADGSFKYSSLDITLGAAQRDEPGAFGTRRKTKIPSVAIRGYIDDKQILNTAKTFRGGQTRAEITSSELLAALNFSSFQAWANSPSQTQPFTLEIYGAQSFTTTRQSGWNAAQSTTNVYGFSYFVDFYKPNQSRVKEAIRAARANMMARYKRGECRLK